MRRLRGSGTAHISPETSKDPRRRHHANPGSILTVLLETSM